MSLDYQLTRIRSLPGKIKLFSYLTKENHPQFRGLVAFSTTSYAEITVEKFFETSAPALPKSYLCRGILKIFDDQRLFAMTKKVKQLILEQKELR